MVSREQLRFQSPHGADCRRLSRLHLDRRRRPSLTAVAGGLISVLPTFLFGTRFLPLRPNWLQQLAEADSQLKSSEKSGCAAARCAAAWPRGLPLEASPPLLHVVLFDQAWKRIVQTSLHGDPQLIGHSFRRIGIRGYQDPCTISTMHRCDTFLASRQSFPGHVRLRASSE